MPRSPSAHASLFSRRWHSALVPIQPVWNRRSTPGARASSDATAAEVHAASEPRRQELFRRLNLAPGGTAALVRMREQLMDALDHRDDLRAVDDDFVHLFSSWFNRGFLVLHHIDWSIAGDRTREDHPLRGRTRDPRLGRSAPPHRSIRPALLRVLSSGAGGRAADLRRSSARLATSLRRSRRFSARSANSSRSTRPAPQHSIQSPTASAGWPASRSAIS